MQRKRLCPPNFTPTMGAYSHGLEISMGTSAFVFVTGQIAINKYGELVSDDIVEQTEFVFENIKMILNEANTDFSSVVKVQIFLTNIDDFSKVSPIRNRYLGDSNPVSTLIGVNALVAKGCKIEVEVIAIKSQVN
jgi:2-iminobutanoate/2-iminopropanoate deaminase